MPVARLAVALLCHPATPTTVVRSIEVLIARNGGALMIEYRVRADPARLRIPARRPTGFADGLWEHTCFEAFMAREGSDGYRELNFSPSGQWASYTFRSYRKRCDEPVPSAAPTIRVRCHHDGVELAAQLNPAALGYGMDSERTRLGLSAVIESIDGAKSYWALRHPHARPDFHHAEAFMLSMDATRETEPGQP